MKEKIIKNPVRYAFNGRQAGIHFTHNDSDAIGCAVLASLAILYEYDTVFNSNGSIDKNIMDFISLYESGLIETKYKNILITDISLKEETANTLQDFAEAHKMQLLLIDHHITNKMSENYPWAIVTSSRLDTMDDDDNTPYTVDELISATGIIGEMNKWANAPHLYTTVLNPFSEPSISRMVRLNAKGFNGTFNDVEGCEDLYYDAAMSYANEISRYDTWEWQHKPKMYDENFTSVLLTFISLEELYKQIAVNLVDYRTPYNDTHHILYDIYIKKIQDDLKYARNNMVVVNPGKIPALAEYKIGIIMEPTYYSEVANTLCKENLDIDIIVILFPSTRTISLRSIREDLNLGRICERIYKGGGHPKAAGAKLSPNDFMNILGIYYEGNELRKLAEKKSNVIAREVSSENTGLEYEDGKEVLKIDEELMMNADKLLDELSTPEAFNETMETLTKYMESPAINCKVLSQFMVDSIYNVMGMVITGAGEISELYLKSHEGDESIENYTKAQLVKETIFLYLAYNMGDMIHMVEKGSDIIDDMIDILSGVIAAHKEMITDVDVLEAIHFIEGLDREAEENEILEAVKTVSSLEAANASTETNIEE